MERTEEDLDLPPLRDLHVGQERHPSLTHVCR